MFKRNWNIVRNIKIKIIQLKYKFRGVNLGKRVYVGKMVNIESEKFKCGDDIYIGQFSYIGKDVEISNYCMISDNVNIIGNDHNYKIIGVPMIYSGRPQKKSPTFIGEDVWIGHAVTIMRGVKIGKGSIIGANSVVTKDIEEYSINVGNPSKKIGYRFDNNEISEHEKKLKERMK